MNVFLSCERESHMLNMREGWQKGCGFEDDGIEFGTNPTTKSRWAH